MTTQAPHPIALTAAGKRLADALPPEAELADIIREAVSAHNDVDGVFWTGVARDVAQAVSAAEILMPAEGAGLREALKRATKELEEIVSFTRAERSCLRSQEISSIERVVLSSRAALASPQPAVEGPVAAGVDTPGWLWSQLMDWCKKRHLPPADYSDLFSIVGRLRTLTPPVDPKPTVPGNDAGMREGLADVLTALDAAQIQECHVNGDKADVISAPPGSTFINEYRTIARCSTGPLWIKQAVAIAKALNFVRSLAPQTGSAGEDPKTPDAGVVLKEACEPWSDHTGEPPADVSPLMGVFGAGMNYTEELLADLLQVSSFYERGDGSEDFNNDATMTLVNILAAAKLWDKDENRPVTALAQPAPVGEDETGVREALAADVLHYIQSSENGLSRVPRQLLCRIEDVLRSGCAPQPPKAETPAGVGDPFDLGDCAPDFPSAVAVEVMSLAWTHAPGDDVDEHCDRYGAVQEIVDSVLRRPEFAALSAVPAARPGDGVDYPHLPLRIIETEDRHGVRCPILIADAADNDIAEFFHSEQASVSQTYEQALALAHRLVSAAAPAADGGRA